MRSVQHYLRSVRDRGLDVQFGVVFGSHAKGAAHQFSDIDLLVVSPRFDSTRERRDIDLLWQVAARTDSRIEPIPCGERQWRTDTSSAIVEIARREGQRISL
jgi:predicted nucleotidyltransferase